MHGVTWAVSIMDVLDEVLDVSGKEFNVEHLIENYEEIYREELSSVRARTRFCLDDFGGRIKDFQVHLERGMSQ